VPDTKPGGLILNIRARDIEDVIDGRSRLVGLAGNLLRPGAATKTSTISFAGIPERDTFTRKEGINRV
jgi:hypothetical protein